MPAAASQAAEMREAIRQAAEALGWEAPAGAAGPQPGEPSLAAQQMAFLSRKGWSWWGGVGWDDAVPAAERRAAEAAAAGAPSAALSAGDAGFVRQQAAGIDEAGRAAERGAAARAPPTAAAPAAAAAASAASREEEMSAPRPPAGGDGGGEGAAPLELEEEELTPRSRAVARDPAVAAVGRRCVQSVPPAAAPAADPHPQQQQQQQSALNPEAKEWRPASGPSPDGRARGDSLLSPHLRLRRKSQAPRAPAPEVDEAPAAEPAEALVAAEEQAALQQQQEEEEEKQEPATPATAPQEPAEELVEELVEEPAEEEPARGEDQDLVPRDLKIAGHDVEPRGRRTLFAITFTLGGEERVASRYYSDFRALRTKAAPRAPPPPFPGKTFFRCSGRALGARQARLDAWLRAAVAASWQAEGAGDAVRRFLAVGEPMSPVTPSSIASPRAISCRG